MWGAEMPEYLIQISNGGADILGNLCGYICAAAMIGAIVAAIIACVVILLPLVGLGLFFLGIAAIVNGRIVEGLALMAAGIVVSAIGGMMIGR